MTDQKLLVEHRVETPEGYVIPLSIETGLVYMHPIRIPTDQDLQMYPHVFFTSPDIWDPSVLDHEITPSLLEDINQHSDDSLLQDSIFDEYGDLHNRAIQTLNIFCDLGSPPPMLTCMTAILLKRIGNLSDPILVGSLNKSSRIPIKSLHVLEAPFQDMITSRSISSPGTLSSTSQDEMRLLPLIPSSVTPQPSMMVVPWPNSLLEETLWYVMPMASNLKNNS